MGRILAILALALLPSAVSGAESVALMTLKGPDGASPAALEEAGRALLARCEMCGFKGVQSAVRNGAVELTAPGGFNPQMQCQIGTLGLFPAKSVEMRVLRDYPDGRYRLPAEVVRSYEAPPGWMWAPCIRHAATQRDEWSACLVSREPSIPLTVPVPLVLGGQPGALHAYYELTEERRRFLGDLSLEKAKDFALIVDGDVLAGCVVTQGDLRAAWKKDRLGNPLSFGNPVLHFWRCRDYGPEVEALVSVTLPFALKVPAASQAAPREDGLTLLPVPWPEGQKPDGFMKNLQWVALPSARCRDIVGKSSAGEVPRVKPSFRAPWEAAAYLGFHLNMGEPPRYMAMYTGSDGQKAYLFSGGKHWGAEPPFTEAAVLLESGEIRSYGK